jgi:hypothetical protein
MKVMALGLLCLSLAACERAPSGASVLREASTKSFTITRGLVEIRGTLSPRDDRDADAEIVLDVRSAERNAEAQYRYRLRIPLASREALELCMLDRHMYALLPRAGATWRSLLTSLADMKDTLEVIRLDGAGEES